MSTTLLDARFDPPAKGQWISLRDHFPRALTPEYTALLQGAVYAGEAKPFAAYGMPVKTLEVRCVHGHVYMGPVPLVGKQSDGLPPAPLLKIAVRLVPAFRRRAKAAVRALAERPWLAEADHWYAVERQEWIDRCSTLQVVDVDDLSTGDLVTHLQACRALARAGYERHFSLHGPDLIPIGLLLARCEDWGVGAEAVLPVMAGASPASVGQGTELDALRAAVDGRRPESLEELRAVAGSAFDAFLQRFGTRMVTGYDLDCRSLGELPNLLVNLACARPAPAVADVSGAALDALRGLVPPADHDELDQLVSDARATFGVRDDNGSLTGAWPVGLLRRAMLAAGRRLTAAGSLAEVDHAVEITVDELSAMLAGASAPSLDEVRDRAALRAARSRLDPPLQLGPTLELPFDALPVPMRTIARAQLILRDTFTVPPGSERPQLRGDGLGVAPYTGVACVASDPADALARLRPGDVLVATGTTPAFNMALSIAGAVVVEEGGLLSHAAVIARELGLPAVIGTAGCMEIPDGATVEVDPVAGAVRVVVGV